MTNSTEATDLIALQEGEIIRLQTRLKLYEERVSRMEEREKKRLEKIKELEGEIEDLEEQLIAIHHIYQEIYIDE